MLAGGAPALAGNGRTTSASVRPAVASVSFRKSNVIASPVPTDIAGAHHGDFVYELVWYPEDNPNGFYGRTLYDVVRYPQGERIDLGDNGIAHSPVGLEDYRVLYRAHLADPDLQDARARWPFICIWDNEEFSDNNWQSMRIEGGSMQFNAC